MVEGATIRDRQLAVLAQVADDLLIVGKQQSGADTPRVRFRSVEDAIPGCGPMGGLHAALTHAHYDTVFALACDMPHVTAAFAGFLLGEATNDVDVVIPRTERGYHPLCAVYRRTCLEAITRRIAASAFALIGILDDVRVRIVAAEDVERFGDRHRLLANVNTPADYAALSQGHER